MIKIQFDAFSNFNFYCERCPYQLGNTPICTKWRNEVYPTRAIEIIMSGDLNSDTLFCINLVESDGCSIQKLRYYIMTYSTCANVIKYPVACELEV